MTRNIQPLVAICIPCYNAQDTIKETLASILDQQYENLSIHVSDNVSTDNTLEIISDLADERVAIHRQSENIGGERNFSRCISLGEGKYTAIYHADDVYGPDMVARQVAFMVAHPQASAVFTGAHIINENGTIVGRIAMPGEVVRQDGLYDFVTIFKAILRHSNFFICPSLLARTDILQTKVKRWRGELFKFSADLDVWLRLLQHGPIGYLNEPLMRYRVSEGQGSSFTRMSTEQAHFFLVTDYYLQKQEVRVQLTDKDFMYYGWLERRDRLMRAVNLFLADKPQLAGDLLYDIFSLDAVKSALFSKRGLYVLTFGIWLQLMLTLKMYDFGKKPIVYFRNIFRK